MRITEKNTPILKYLNWDKQLDQHKDFGKADKQGIFAVNIPDQLKYGRERIEFTLRPFIDRWPDYQKLYTKTVDVISIEFMRAAFTNFNKLITAETLATLRGNTISGTMMCGELSICYYYEFTEDNNYISSLLVHQHSLLAFASTENGEFLADIDKTKRQIIEQSSLSYKDYLHVIPIVVYLFKRYATVEIIPAKPFKKVPLPMENDNLLVDSTVKVNYVDCSWFRTIVRKEGFLVRGHFRLQRYKNEEKEWDYKLIYIDPYQKHGYTRTAKKLIQERKEEEK